MSDQPYPLTSSLAYRDPEAAMEWLQKAFGCEIDTLLTDKDGKIAHLVMSFRGQPFGVMREWESEALIGPAKMRSPESLKGSASAFMRASVDGLAAHYERACAAGARITQGPTLQFYGDRTFRCLDLEGHIWNFQQREVDVSLEEIERTQGFKTIKA